MDCRTYEAGRIYYECATCNGWQMMPAACGHRACAQCGLHKARDWETRQQMRLLPVPYVMVTFTVPSELRAMFRSHQKVCYQLLMQESSATLREIAADSKHLGGEIGATGVLHTWKRDLGYHPHIHYLLPAGAWNGERWVAPKKDGYFLPSAVLATRMRNRFRDRLKEEHPEVWKTVPSSVWKATWNVNVQFVGKGEKAFGYLARYVQSTAIRNRRIANVTEKSVTYAWIDRKTQQPRSTTVSGREFVRRFLQHVLPKGVVRVRHIGFLSAAAKKTFKAVRTALGVHLAPIPLDSQIGTGEKSEPTEAEARNCCSKCRKPMKFSEFRSAKRPETPARFALANRQLPESVQTPSRIPTAQATEPQSDDFKQAARGPPA